MTAGPPMLAPGPREWPVVRMLTCPVPPSTNNLYRNVPKVGRVMTAAYKRWREAAGKELMLVQRAPRLTGEVKIGLTIPRDNRRDADNEIKPLLDLLVRLGVIERDNMSCVVGLSIECEKRDDVAIWLRQRGKT